MNEFRTILSDEIAETEEKKSKFIANIFYVESVIEAENKIKEIKKKYYDSKHNCVAYRIAVNDQIVEKSSDNGEPSGTAGGPMLNILQKNNLCNVIVIVTRYFGGILLGTGGLVRAYSEATQKAIEKCNIINKIEGIEFKIEIDYTNFDIFKYYCKNNDIKIKEINYRENIIMKIEMEKNRKNFFLEDINTKTVKINKYQELQTIFIDKNVIKNK